MIWTGLPALAAALLAAAWPRAWTAALALLATVVGLGWALPASGATAASWAVGLGLVALGLTRPQRAWPLLALPWLWAGAVGRPLAGVAWPELASSLLAATMLAATTAGLLSNGRGRAAALVLAVLPWAPAGGSILHGWATLPLAIDGTAAAVQVSGSFGVDLNATAPWVGWLQIAARGVVLLAVWQPRWWRPLLGLAGLLLGLETGLALGLPHWHVAGLTLPLARGATFDLDPTLLLLALARLSMVGWLLHGGRGPERDADAGSRLLLTVDLLTWLGGAALAVAWASTALDAGLGDPALGALLGVVLASGLARAAETEGRDTLSTLGRGVAWLAALWLVGGAVPTSTSLLVGTDPDPASPYAADTRSLAGSGARMCA